MRALDTVLATILLYVALFLLCCDVRVNGKHYGHRGGCNYSWGEP